MAIKEVNPFAMMCCTIVVKSFFHRVSADSLGRGLLALFEELPELAPSKFDVHEPVRTRFTPAAFLDALSDSDSGSMNYHCLRGREIVGQVYRFSSGNSTEDVCYFHYRLDLFGQEILGKFADGVAQLFQPDLLFMHALSDREGEEAMRLKVAERRRGGWGYSGGVRWPQFGISQLAWRTYFGPLYVRHFGREKLLSTPVDRVVEHKGGIISIQLTDDIHEIDKDWEHFDANRKAAIAHLGASNFQRVRGPDDPPCSFRPEDGILYGDSFPPEFRPLRERSEEYYRRELLKAANPPAVSSLEEALVDPKRFRVVRIRAGKGRTSRIDTVIVDDMREEMMGFADEAMRDEWVKALLDAGATEQDLT